MTYFSGIFNIRLIHDETISCAIKVQIMFVSAKKVFKKFLGMRNGAEYWHCLK